MASHILADLDEVSGQSAASLFQDLAVKGIVSDSTAQSLAKTVGFRDLLVHRYADIDWKLVYHFITSDLKIFSEFAEQVSKRN